MNPPMQRKFWSFLSEWIYECKQKRTLWFAFEWVHECTTNVSYIRFIPVWMNLEIQKYNCGFQLFESMRVQVSSFIVNICVWILWRSGITDQIRQAPHMWVVVTNVMYVVGTQQALLRLKFCGFCLCLSDMRPSWRPHACS
jgi:hypothetical protein